MSRKRKIPAVPNMVPRKYHHEIKCVFEDFQRNILNDILRGADLDDKAFLEVVDFSLFAEATTGALRMMKNLKGNEISKRLFEIRTGDTEGSECGCRECALGRKKG